SGKEQESPQVEFARLVVESYVRKGTVPPASEAAAELRGGKAGVFVTLKKRGKLRGCMGTVQPVKENVAEEIRGNAVSSVTFDPRFDAVTADELGDLEYSVDVLEEPEDIAGIDELDTSVYGVIVRSGDRSGLLLPDLEGIDTPEEQVRIAMIKAGIHSDEPVLLQRFKISRYK
ncbi:MAG: AmmeMemoRadiSam system protein A, partial [Actinobacteria bacterium]|nr:AmmeMemoRadiSam system protein A [Actinomycetota bacterium]